MWRSLSVARGDIVMFADADSTDFREHFIYGTLGPLLTDPGIQFSKAAYRRPFTSGGKSVVDGGGRVTELMAKPLLNFYFPELTGFVQPLAGEFAAHRELLCSIPFVTGYGVEIAMMIDVLAEAGLPAMAQVDLEYRQNRHQALWDLTRMSSAVLRALAGGSTCANGSGFRTRRRTCWRCRGRTSTCTPSPPRTGCGWTSTSTSSSNGRRSPTSCRPARSGTRSPEAAGRTRAGRAARPARDRPAPHDQFSGGRPTSRRSRRRRRPCRPRRVPAGGTCPP